MENTINQLAERWKTIEWLMDSYKDTDVPLLKLGEEDFESLETDQLTVQGNLIDTIFTLYTVYSVYTKYTLYSIYYSTIFTPILSLPIVEIIYVLYIRIYSIHILFI
jgi:hypothetical protein